MADENILAKWKQKLLNVKFIAALVLVTIAVGGITTFAVNIDKLLGLIRPKPPTISGTLSIANDLCPYIEYQGEQLRPRGTEGLTFYRPTDEFLVIWPRIHMEALSPTPPEASDADFTPSWVQAQESRLHPHPIVGMKSLRLLIYGSTVINRLYKSYEMRKEKAPYLNEVFNPLPDGRVARFYHTLRYLARLYPPLDASPELKELALNLVKLNRELLPTKAELTNLEPELQELFVFYEHLLLRHTDPVLRLTLTNLGNDPIIVTSLVCQLKKVFPAMDTYESGPLEILGSVTFKLPSQPAIMEQLIPQGPVKLAPKDAGSFIIRLKGYSKGAFQLSFSVMRKSILIYETGDVLVGILGG